MRTVTDLFKSKITTQTEARDVYGRVKFSVVNLEATQDLMDNNGTTANYTDPISQAEYATDGIDGVITNYASFELDRFSMGGGFKLQPDDSGDCNNMGWWSSVLDEFDASLLSDSVTREFPTPLVLTCEFTVDFSSEGLTIFFDESNDEYAEDFSFTFYNSADAEIVTLNVTGNTQARYVFIYETAIADYRKLVLTVSKWSKANRVARVSEISFGLIKVFDKGSNSLVSMEINEVVDLTSATIPYNTITFSVDNSDREYDILNPDGSYIYMQKNQKIQAEIGVNIGGGVVEYTDVGTFYLNEWKTNGDEITATFTGYDRLKYLGDINGKYEKGVYATDNLHDMAVDIFTEMGLVETTDYVLDASLSGITTTAYMPIVTYREALQYIAVAGMCIFYVDRDNIIHIKPVGSTNSGIDLDFDNVYNTPKIELNDVVIKTTVEEIEITQEATVSTEVFKTTINGAGTTEVVIYYSTPATVTLTDCTITGGAGNTVNSGTFYASMAIINVTTTATQTLTVMGKKLSNNIKIMEARPDPVESTGVTLNVKNPLITNTTMSSNVALWVLDTMRKRYNLTIDWRMNPILELGDIVDIETQYYSGLDKVFKNDMMITKQIITYNGALTGQTLVKGN